MPLCDECVGNNYNFPHKKSLLEHKTKKHGRVSNFKPRGMSVSSKRKLEEEEAAAAAAAEAAAAAAAAVTQAIISKEQQIVADLYRYLKPLVARENITADQIKGHIDAFLTSREDFDKDDAFDLVKAKRKVLKANIKAIYFLIIMIIMF